MLDVVHLDVRIVVKNPTRARFAMAAATAAALGLVACSSATADVDAAELQDVVRADAIAFEADSIPASVVDRLATHRVVLLGETHHLREHWEFVATMMADLYDHGFRQLLIEAPHMAGWLLDDYVQGSPIRPQWIAPPFYERRLSMIREFNQSHADDPIHVSGIDANEEWYGGAGDFQLLLGWFVHTLPTPWPTETLQRIAYASADPQQQRRAIEDLLASLEADRADLTDSWGAERYDQLVELLMVESASIDVRVARAEDDDSGARMREDVIKGLADDRIGECTCGTVINIGAHHAQMAHLMGTDQEWLGDHLAHRSDAVGGSIIVVGVTSARTELEPGADGTSWDILNSASPDDELLRTIAETMPGQTVFLPLDDTLFAERTVAYNSEDVIYVTALAEQFDAVLQYSLSHRMPVD
jgi:hypothetical protein